MPRNEIMMYLSIHRVFRDYTATTTSTSLCEGSITIDDGYTHDWDGTSRGSSLPAGSYLYLIQNGPDKHKGTATILL